MDVYFSVIVVVALIVESITLVVVLLKYRSLKQEVATLKLEIGEVEIRMAENLSEFTDMISEDLNRLEGRSGFRL